MVEKSPNMKLLEWLHENGYSNIHQEWFTELAGRQPYELPLAEWLQSHYPDVWEEYNSGS